VCFESEAVSGLDAVVVGGGPAGAAAAVYLARLGRAVTLIEQSRAAHDKVCGEFLSREAMTSLDWIGLSPSVLGAVPIYAVRLAAHREIAACDLPFPAVSLTRRRLDEALIKLAEESGAAIRRGKRVDALQADERGWKAEISGGESVQARTAFLATGKHDVTGYRRPAGAQNDLVAFKMYFRLAAVQQRTLHGWIELFLFPGGYAGLQLTEDGDANLCLLVNRATLRRCHHDWNAILEHLQKSSALLAERLDGAQATIAKPLALSSIPYGLLRREATADLWPLGDQAAVIPSFSGDGISIALYSAHFAADLYARGRTSSEFLNRMRTELRGSVTLATTLSRLMIAAPALAQATRLWPALLQLIASRTRIPLRAWAAQPALSQR
jgi:flavin-dependent dehydrogenase